MKIWTSDLYLVKVLIMLCTTTGATFRILIQHIISVDSLLFMVYFELLSTNISYFFWVLKLQLGLNFDDFFKLLYKFNFFFINVKILAWRFLFFFEFANSDFLTFFQPTQEKYLLFDLYKIWWNITFGCFLIMCL